MPHSFSAPLPSIDLGVSSSSSSSSSRSSRSSTRNHSPPPLWSATDKLVLRIKHFLDTDIYGSNDLVLSSVTPVEFAAFRRELRRPCFLHPAQVSSIRYTWNRQTNILTVSCMPGSVHDSIVPYLVYFTQEIPFTQPGMTNPERRAFMFFSGTDVTMFPNPPLSIITGHGKHVLGLVKQPDAAFKFVGGRGSDRNGFPRVVFEVAFSQTYDSVLEDARQWLVRSKGAVKLCVIVKIYEQPNIYKEIDHTEIKSKLEEQRRIRESYPEEEEPMVIEETGLDEDPSPDASINTTEESSSSASYDERMFSVAGRALFLNSHEEHATWVGPLTGFMEFYRLSEDATGIQRDGPRYDIFDPTGPDPVLRISDLLPADAIEGDPNRAYPLLLSEYRRFIEMGVEDLALMRKMRGEFANGKGEANADPEYQNDGEESEESGGSAKGDESGRSTVSGDTAEDEV